MRTARLLPAALLIAFLVAPSTACSADFGIAPGSFSIRALDRFGDPENRAGAHPDRLRIDLSLDAGDDGAELKDLLFELPPGLAGNPGAVEACSRTAFDVFGSQKACPPQSQIGVARVTRRIANSRVEEAPIFNIAPAPGQIGEFGFNVFVKFPLSLSLRPADLGVDIGQSGIVQVLDLATASIELWGVPADHQEEAPSVRRPFLTLPSRCGEPVIATIRVRSWQSGAPWKAASAEDVAPLSGCQSLPFEPSLGFDIASSRADSPTGAQIEVAVPQNEEPDGVATSQIRRATISLPDGMTVSPGAAADLRACSDSQFALGSSRKATCPPGSRVGEVRLSSPLAREPLSGDVYVGEERPGDRFRLFVVAAALGAEAKMAGSIHLDPATGQLTAVLDDLPQLPLSQLSLRFDGGDGALLANPLRCGPVTAVATFEPYGGGASVRSTDNLTIAPREAGASCSGDLPFAPSLRAGTTSARAGRATTFSMTLRRSEGEETLGKIGVAFPPGLSARLGSLQPCEPTAVREGRCPDAARVGSAVAELGSGTSPAALDGDAFLTGPYRGAPFGLALDFDPVLGPFDLGNLTIRAALRLDPRTGRMSVETDSLPQVVEGFPVRLRTLGIDIDRPGFIANPTSCRPSEVVATGSSTGAESFRSASPFRVRGCNALSFRPRLAVGLIGGEAAKQGERDEDLGLRVTLRSQPGGTNLRSASITLPRVLAFKLSGLKAICSRRDAIRGVCSEDAKVGTVTARSPLLGSSLGGPVYVVQPADAGLPELWTVVKGAGVSLEMRSKMQAAQGSFRTTLVNLPDLPLSSFTMRLGGKRRDILSLAGDRCDLSDRQAKATGVFEGQDGAASIARVEVERPGCGAEVG